MEPNSSRSSTALPPNRLLFFLAALVLLNPLQAGAAGRQQLHGHRTYLYSTAPLVGRHPAASRMHLALCLPARNTQTMDELLKNVYDPHNPLYRHYLNPEQFGDMFGASPEDYEALKAFAVAHHLEITATFKNRLVLDVTGSTKDVEDAFYTRINDYRRPNGSVFYGPDQEPSLDLDVPVQHISGLNNEVRPHPKYRRLSANTARPRQNGGSGYEGALFDNDYRHAYASGVTLTGSGQKLALFEFTVYDSKYVTDYEAACSPALSVPVSNVYLDGFNSSTSPDCTSADGYPEIEVLLDIELSMSMAPGLNQVYVYMGGGNAIDIFERIANDNACRQVSCSWGWGPDDQPSGTYSDSQSTENTALDQMALQGQSFFLASGDGEPNSNPDGPDIPGAFVGDPPYGSANYDSFGNEDEIDQTEVGATELNMSGTGAAWSSEEAIPASQGWQSTGGILEGDLTGDSIPSYQAAPGVITGASYGSTTYRNVPDVSCVGLDCEVYDCYSTSTEIDEEGGTSCAAPLWAGFTALVNEQAALSGKGSLGFPNPSLYAIGTGSDYTTDFHDITTGNNGSATQFPAVTGYDLATGWGSPNGQGLINDLVGSLPTVTPTFTPTVTRTPTITYTPTITFTPTATVAVPFALSANEVNSQSGPPLTIFYQVVSGGQVTIDVYNVLGQQVRQVLSTSQVPGRYGIPWDGKDDKGTPLSTGLYVVAYSENNNAQLKKVLVIKR